MDRHTFIINPVAGRTDQSAEISGKIKKAAKKLGIINYEIKISEYHRHAVEIVTDTAEKFPEDSLRFYACGGDGTLNEVAEGTIGRPNCAFTHFPSGSGNDFIKIFGAENISRFLNPESLITGDIIRLDYIDSSHGLSINILSAGIDARVARRMEKYRRVFAGGSAAYNLSIIENVLLGLHDPYKVEIDGRRLDGRYTLIMAANGRYYGGGFYAMPDADPADGIIEVLLVKAVSRLTVAHIIGLYQKGKYKELPEIIHPYRMYKKMTISSGNNKPITLNLDGETMLVDSVTFSPGKEKLRFIVPKGLAVAAPGN
ncbi:MAG: hypothetical protein LBC56_06550 [Oscillospiraceae bacterium]|jgi:diacylglycerol kinase family enzyme|nr:hypothetical protein [Oscillospiraceae bacterium]